MGSGFAQREQKCEGRRLDASVSSLPLGVGHPRSSSQKAGNFCTSYFFDSPSSARTKPCRSTGALNFRSRVVMRASMDGVTAPHGTDGRARCSIFRPRRTSSLLSPPAGGMTRAQMHSSRPTMTAMNRGPQPSLNCQTAGRQGSIQSDRGRGSGTRARRRQKEEGSCGPELLLRVHRACVRCR